MFNALPLSERGVLRLSIVATLSIALYGLVIGICTNSQSILFECVFAFIDAAMTTLSWYVSCLLDYEGSRRFQYGYWHLEPLAAMFNGMVLTMLCLYAIIDALNTLASGGGRGVALSTVLLYALPVGGLCFLLYLYERHANKIIASELIRIDMQSFLMSACITVALMLGFALTAAIEENGTALSTYADSFVLLLLSLGLLPVPLRVISRAFREILLIAPRALHEHVRAAVQPVLARHGLTHFRSYVAKIGRMNIVDIHILVPRECAARVVECDVIRDEIATALSPYARLDQWLSISFTTRREWT